MTIFNSFLLFFVSLPENSHVATDVSAPFSMPTRQEEELKKKVGPITKAREVEIAGAPKRPVKMGEDELNPDWVVEVVEIFMPLSEQSFMC